MEPRKQRSTEHYGVGQSGYTAGRVENDRSLEEQLEDRNASYPKDYDEESAGLEDDERFTGRGRRRWIPAEPSEPSDRPRNE